jgi:dodecin
MFAISLREPFPDLSAYTRAIWETPTGRAAMNEHVYKTIEITGTSRKGAEDAIRVALEKAAQSVHNMRWFKVIETRGNIDNGKIDYWQVTLDLGFTLE